MVVYALSYCDCFCAAATDRRGEGDSGLDIDKNSCDRNEEWSVLKRLSSTPAFTL